MTLVDRMRAILAGGSTGSISFWMDGRWTELEHAAFLCTALGWAESLDVRPGDVGLVLCRTPRAAATAFFGLLARGAVPVMLPDQMALRGAQRMNDLLSHWAARFGPRTFVVAQEKPEFAGRYVSIDAAPSAVSDALPASPAPDDLAYIQVTSGSTDRGKATAISHANVLANLRGILAHSGDRPERCVSWLPLYHDMGLVGGLLWSIVSGHPLHLLAPFDFLLDPGLWLRTISETRATVSPAPNFGYDFCARRADAAGLDLSSWRIAYCGAEPVRVDTFAAFLARFGPAGFRAEAVLPCYGLAEATLAVTLTDADVAPGYVVLAPGSRGLGDRVEVLADGRLGDGVSDAVLSVGRPVSGLSLDLMDGDVVIDADDVCGELVVQGDSVALGYFGGEPFGGVVRTGDIGFFHCGELYVVDRLKQIIIRNGINYSVAALEAQLARALNVAERGVCVFEAEPGATRSPLVALVEAAPVEVDGVAADLPISRVVFVPPRTIPRTTSGKKRHGAARDRWVAGVDGGQTVQLTRRRG